MDGERLGEKIGPSIGADIGAVTGASVDRDRLGEDEGASTGASVKGETDSSLTVTGGLLLIPVVVGVIVSGTVGVLVKYEKSMSP